MSEPVRHENEAGPRSGSVQVEITYFTDPLCCWSWGFEPQLRRLRYAYAGQIAWRLRMGGMISGWDGFEDPVNAIYRPAQMAPLWLQARHITGMPIEANIWVHDPPSSSWPACMAVKTAELQSAVAADLYLRRLREAVMVESRNIAQNDTLLEIADELGSAAPALFDADRFRVDFGEQDARKAFEDDIREARFRGIGRFPALVLRRPSVPAKVLVGWRPYAALESELVEYAPRIGAGRKPGDADSYRAYWIRLTERELADAMAPCSDTASSYDIGLSSARGIS